MSSEQSDPNNQSTPFAPSTNDELPYTLTHSISGNKLEVRFTSGEMQGQHLSFNLPEIQARTDRDRAAGRNQAPPTETYEYREEDLPETSYHDAEGRLISKEEYEVIAARELAEGEEAGRRDEAGSVGTGHESRNDADDEHRAGCGFIWSDRYGLTRAWSVSG